MHRACAMLRSGDRLSRERARFVAAALLIASAAGFLFLVVAVCPATTLATPCSFDHDNDGAGAGRRHYCRRRNRSRF